MPGTRSDGPADRRATGRFSAGADDRGVISGPRSAAAGRRRGDGPRAPARAAPPSARRSAISGARRRALRAPSAPPDRAPRAERAPRPAPERRRRRRARAAPSRGAAAARPSARGCRRDAATGRGAVAQQVVGAERLLVDDAAPGTASTSRPSSSASRAVTSEPERGAASTTTQAVGQRGDQPVAHREVASAPAAVRRGTR